MMEDKELERLKEIFVTRRECQNNLDSIETKISKDMVKLAVIESRLKTISWVLYAVAGGVIAIVVEMILVR